MRVLILGASGMLGNATFRLLHGSAGLEVTGTLRSAAALRHFTPDQRKRLVYGIDAEDDHALVRVLTATRPNVLINCVGLIKQIQEAHDPLEAIRTNALLPHRLARLCGLAECRLIHISTDCVFSGTRGGYRETDVRDADELYGRSKALGEVEEAHTITLRTSIIGHELDSAHGLIGWFLAQQGLVKGYTRAIFSGLPTIELASVIRDVVMPMPQLSGIFHVASAPIAKHDLLQLVKRVYGHTVDIVPDSEVVIDRSLDSTRFRETTGYVAPDWPTLVSRMHAFK